MKKSIPVLILVLTAFFLASKYCSAQSSSLTIMVSARVVPIVSLNVMSQQGVVQVTSEDVHRGYVDVKAGTVIQVRTNSSDGYLLSFEYTAGPFNEIWVIDGGRTTALAGMRGLIREPYSGGLTGETKELSYRFFLAEGAVPGSYSWPLVVNAVVN